MTEKQTAKGNGVDLEEVVKEKDAQIATLNQQIARIIQTAALYAQSVKERGNAESKEAIMEQQLMETLRAPQPPQG